MMTVDGRCSDRRCADSAIYRMVGKCSNCHTEDVLMLFTAGHESYYLKCPVCENNTVMPLAPGDSRRDPGRMTRAEVECPECGGQGWYTASAHAPACNGFMCAPECPVPVQERCEACHWTGKVEIDV